jgi:hypothetical protein
MKTCAVGGREPSLLRSISRHLVLAAERIVGQQSQIRTGMWTIRGPPAICIGTRKYLMSIEMQGNLQASLHVEYSTIDET